MLHPYDLQWIFYPLHSFLLQAVHLIDLVITLLDFFLRITLFVTHYSLCYFYFILLQMCFDAFDEAADLDVLDHPILNLIYYLVRFLFFVFFLLVWHLCLSSSLSDLKILKRRADYVCLCVMLPRFSLLFINF